MKMNIFNSVELRKPKTSTFDMTHDVKFSSRFGELTPVFCQEVLPGDKWNISAQSLIRFQPLIAPVMHRMDATVHYFYVPNRILWEGWEDFIMNNEPRVMPTMLLTMSLTDPFRRFLDYMGVPLPKEGPGVEFDPIRVNALPFAAYLKIYNDYYRDQNLIEDKAAYCDLADGTVPDPQMLELLTMRLRAYEHDYFTASLPFAQKGADVDIPLGTVELREDWKNGTSIIGDPNFIQAGGAGVISSDDLATNADGDIVPATGGTKSAYDPDGTLEVGSTTIKELRTAFRLQEWLEKMATAGSRYIEGLWSHFFVKSDDARLQRPEYIVGVKQPIVVSEVLNTTGEDGGLPQGNMAGHAVSVGSGSRGSYYAKEHGWIIGIQSVMPKTAYMQGLHRHFSRRSPLDFAWPSFALIGEQEVKNQELFLMTTDDLREQTFGYVPRYAEYKYAPSRVAGDMRFSLDYWHLGRKFADLPVLNSEFIECSPDDQTRIFAVEDGTDEIICHTLHIVKANRRLPYFGTPTI